MIRNDTVRVVLNSSDDIYPTSISITEGIGKGYNNATLSGTNLIDVNCGDVLSIIINTDDIYEFVIDKKDISDKGKVTITCYGKPIVLTDGKPSNTEFSYSTSDELIESCCNGIIQYENNLPTITFTGQTYVKTSTPMERILDMVSVIGGEAFEVDGELKLNELAIIPETPTIAHTFDDSEVFSYAYSENRTSSNLTKEVLFNPVVDDIYSDVTATLDFDEDLSKGQILFNPSLSSGYKYYIDGIDSRKPLTINRVETFTLTDTTFVNTLGGIDSIEYITLNGEPFSDYIIYDKYNVVMFNAEYSGELVVSYKTLSVTVYCYQTSDFSIKYECSICSGTIEINADNTINSGNCYADIKSPLTYENGGTVYLSSGVDYTFIFVEKKGATNLVQYTTLDLSGGGVITIKYLYNTTDWTDTDFMDNLTSTTVSKIETMSGEVIYDENLDSYVLYLDKPIDSINDIYFGSLLLDSVSYSYVGTGLVPYIEFTDNTFENSTLDISVNSTFDEVVIPAPQENHPVTLLDVITCSGVATGEFVPDDSVMCDLPATFKIDVASLFDLEISDIFGATLTGDFGDLVIDNFGQIEVTVTIAKVYIIDASSIKDSATIKVDAEGVV